MKASKSHRKSVANSSRREVSLSIRECQVTMKVKTPVPQVKAQVQALRPTYS